ncbi:MAG: hypothetical protein ACMG6S_00610 [Byssovorax sp.]
MEVIDVEDRDRVGVVERRGGAGLAHEASAGVGGREALGDHLEGDTAAEAGIVGAVNAAHAALTDEGLDGVALEGVAGVEHQRRRG